MCVECLVGEKNKPTLFKVTEPSSVPYRSHGFLKMEICIYKKKPKNRVRVWDSRDASVLVCAGVECVCVRARTCAVLTECHDTQSAQSRRKNE